MNKTHPPAAGERILAALAHFSLLLGGLGLWAPVLVWALRRSKSQYSTFQALQALGYGIFIALYDFVVAPLALIVMLILLVLVGQSHPLEAAQVDAALDGFVFILLAMMALPRLLTILAALVCLFGSAFRYPLLAGWLAEYLRIDGAGALDPQREDRYVAAMAHACVVYVAPANFIPYFVATPLIAALSSKERSQLLHDQSLQALVFQLASTVLTTVFMLVPLVLLGAALAVSGSASLASGAAQAGGGNFNGPALLLFGLMMLSALVILLLYPLLQTFGLVASYRMLKGKNYEYPLIGKLVKGWSWI